MFLKAVFLEIIFSHFDLFTKSMFRTILTGIVCSTSPQNFIVKDLVLRPHELCEKGNPMQKA